MPCLTRVPNGQAAATKQRQTKQDPDEPAETRASSPHGHDRLLDPCSINVYFGVHVVAQKICGVTSSVSVLAFGQDLSTVGCLIAVLVSLGQYRRGAVV